MMMMIIIIVVTIKNIINKLYTIKFFLLPNNRLCSLSLSRDYRFCGTHVFHRAHGFCQACEFHRTC